MNFKMFYRDILRFLASITGYFKLVEESAHVNEIRSITKDDSGNTVVEISPRNSNNSIFLKTSDFFKNYRFSNFLRPHDQKLIQLLLLCEGDIFIESKSFEPLAKNTSEILNLVSSLSKERWSLTKDQLINNKKLFSRLNKKYLENTLNLGT